MASAKSITEHPTMQAIEAWQRQIATPVNVSPPERLVSTIGGGILRLFWASPPQLAWCHADYGRRFAPLSGHYRA